MATAIKQASGDLPLCVDLDGTLIKSDLTLESLVNALRRKPWIVFLLPLWFLRGKSVLKDELAARGAIDATTLPYDEQVVALAQSARQSGRAVLLVTGSHRKYADQVQAHTQLFDDVLATSRDLNFTGIRKVEALDRLFGTGRYEYVANAAVDLPIWRAAAAAVTVAAPSRVVRKVAKLGKPHIDLPRHGSTLKIWIKALRLRQWVKNALLFIPIITAHKVSDPSTLAAGALAFVCFGVCASATYLINDLFDLQADRRHAKKRHRPFASGALALRSGLLVIPLMIALGLALSLLLPIGFTLALSAYVVITLAYSFSLKEFASLDVITLAGLYTLRIIAGAFAVAVSLSFWLLAFSMFIFLSLAVVKRVAELLETKKKESQTGDTLGIVHGRGYRTEDAPVMQTVGATSGYLSVLVLAFYIQSPEVSLLYRTPEILWLIAPVLLVWVTRLWVVTARGYMDEDPIFFAVKDPETWITAVATAAILTAATLVQL